MTRIFVCFAAAVFVSQLSASVGSSCGPGSGCSAGMRWGSGTMVGGPEAMRIRGGMADQMAEIRAMRARQYEEAKKVRGNLMQNLRLAGRLCRSALALEL